MPMASEQRGEVIIMEETTCVNYHPAAIGDDVCSGEVGLFESFATGRAMPMCEHHQFRAIEVWEESVAPRRQSEWTEWQLEMGWDN